MQELISKLISGAGINEDQARKVLTVIQGFVKDKYPIAEGYLNKFLGKDETPGNEGEGVNLGGFKF